MTPAEALRELSEPFSRGDRVRTAIERAARLTGLSYTRAFDVWYGKARRIEPHEIEAITEALQKKREREAKNELQELRIRIAKLEARLSQADAIGSTKVSRLMDRMDNTTQIDGRGSLDGPRARNTAAKSTL